jgi:hypothetical protein
MRIETTSRSDQTGFWLRPTTGNFLLACHWWSAWRPVRSLLCWLVVVNVLGGAGYLRHGRARWLAGRTFYLGWRARGGVPGRPHGPWPRLRIGLTRNANHVPFGFGS